jgi:hypothetical protein
MTINDVKTCSDAILRMLEEKRFNRAPESNRALIAAGLSIQIMVTLGLKFLAQTASLTWSPDHVLVNFDVGLAPCFVDTHDLALFLVEWLCSMESPGSVGGSDEEKKVYNLLSQLLHGACSIYNEQSLSVRFITMVFTTDTVNVWGGQ